ncbi:MAG: dicarboxylate/amino acid:cation symporter [Simkaniaceae bacterium]|nr:dicarboxylate/amino acid:cation symporter [Simkaniaceae bacterium]
MKKFFTNQLIFITFLLGVIFGVWGPSFVVSGANLVADLFINVLKLISLPMIFLAIVSTIINMTSLSEARNLLLRTLKYTLITTIVAATIGLVLFLCIHPAHNGAASAAPLDIGNKGYLEYILGIFPDNIIRPFVEGNVIGIAVIAAILSIAILKLPEKQRDVLRPFFGALFNAMLKITTAVIRILPIAVFAFTVQFIDSIRENSHLLHSIVLYAVCVIGANLIQGFVVLPLLLKMKGISPTRHFRAMLPAVSMAFFTKSSNATLPLTISCAEKRAGISPRTSKFALPLCSIINMNGCAAFILITTLFVSMSAGMHFTAFELVGWIFLSTLAAIGNAGVPMGCYFLTTSFLIGMGVPLELMGIILPVYTIIDMVETALNVYSDSCAAAVVDKELEPVAEKA